MHCHMEATGVITGGYHQEVLSYCHEDNRQQDGIFWGPFVEWSPVSVLMISSQRGTLGEAIREHWKKVSMTTYAGTDSRLLTRMLAMSAPHLNTFGWGARMGNKRGKSGNYGVQESPAFKYFMLGSRIAMHVFSRFPAPSCTEQIVGNVYKVGTMLHVLIADWNRLAADYLSDNIFSTLPDQYSDMTTKVGEELAAYCTDPTNDVQDRNAFSEEAAYIFVEVITAVELGPMAQQKRNNCLKMTMFIAMHHLRIVDWFDEIGPKGGKKSQVSSRALQLFVYFCDVVGPAGDDELWKFIETPQYALNGNRCFAKKLDVFQYETPTELTWLVACAARELALQCFVNVMPGLYDAQQLAEARLQPPPPESEVTKLPGKSAEVRSKAVERSDGTTVTDSGDADGGGTGSDRKKRRAGGLVETAPGAGDDHAARRELEDGDDAPPANPSAMIVDTSGS